MIFRDALEKVLEGAGLTRELSCNLFTQLMAGEASPVQIAALVSALRAKGESVAEITGAAEAMRQAAVPVRSAGVVVDTCGTGGDGQGTVNISTIAAFIVAGAGFTVAKHGNRSLSSRCGSADVLEAAGIAVQPGREAVERCLAEVGIAFLFAPDFHPAMRHAMPVRKELGVRTIFNVLGPLTNPAKPTVQVVGVYSAQWVKPLAHVLAALGCEEGAVVHGGGHDEIVLDGSTEVAEIIHGRVRLKRWTPRDFGITPCKKVSLKGSDADGNAHVLLGVLSGDQNDAQVAACVNAAAAIRSALRSKRGAGKSITLKESMRLAEYSLNSGKALEKFMNLKSLLERLR